MKPKIKNYYLSKTMIIIETIVLAILVILFSQLLHPNDYSISNCSFIEGKVLSISGSKSIYIKLEDSDYIYNLRGYKKKLANLSLLRKVKNGEKLKIAFLTTHTLLEAVNFLSGYVLVVGIEHEKDGIILDFDKVRKAQEGKKYENFIILLFIITIASTIFYSWVLTYLAMRNSNEYKHLLNHGLVKYNIKKNEPLEKMP